MALPAHLILIFTTILICVTSVAAQQANCTVKLEQLPEVRRLQIGLTADQIRERYPNFKAPPPDRYGYAQFEYDFMLERGSLVSIGDTIREPLDGIDKTNLASVAMALLDNKVVLLRINYKTSVQWKDVNEFLGAISGPLGLPGRDHWSERGRGALYLACEDYVVQVSALFPDSSSSIEFQKRGYAEAIERRKEAEKAQRKQSFKP